MVRSVGRLIETAPPVPRASRANSLRRVSVSETVARGDHHIVIGEAVDAHTDAPIEGRPDDAILRVRELGDNVFYGG